MTKAVTAIYRDFATADLVRTDLQSAGIAAHDIKIVPESESLQVATRDDDPQWNDDLHALNLPEDDLRTYQNAVRKGDTVVSVELDGDDDLARIKEIMRHPEREAYDLDALDTMYAGTEYTPKAGTTAYAADDRFAGTRDAAVDGEDARVRAYTRPSRYSYEAAGYGETKRSA